MTSSSITIIFTKNENVQDDSHLSYKRTEEGIHVMFREGNSYSSIMLEKEQAYLHLLTILKILKFDRDPYKSVQLWFPGVPSVLLQPKDFATQSELLEHVMNLFGLTVYVWFEGDKDTSQQ